MISHSESDLSYEAQDAVRPRPGEKKGSVRQTHAPVRDVTRLGTGSAAR